MHNFILFCLIPNFFTQFECGHFARMLQNVCHHLPLEVTSGHFTNLIHGSWTER